MFTWRSRPSFVKYKVAVMVVHDTKAGLLQLICGKAFRVEMFRDSFCRKQPK